jgi:hypothetical protein
LYQQPAAFNPQPFENTLTTIRKGKGYLKGGQLVTSRWTFSAVNYFSLGDMQAILRSLIFPEAVPAAGRFNLTDDDYRFVRKHMSMFPHESTWPKYDTSHYPSYGKFFLYGDTKAPFPPTSAFSTRPAGPTAPLPTTPTSWTSTAAWNFSSRPPSW